MQPLYKVLLGLLLFLIFVSVAYVYTQIRPSFGKAPYGARLERIQNSPHYKNRSFDNLEPTPAMVDGQTFFGAMYKMLFKRSSQNKPASVLSFQKTDLFSIPIDENTLVWMGHSSYYLQIDGKRILVDPVLSGSASPFSGSIKAFGGTDLYTPQDIPELDYLIITHDHWDHLDYHTVIALFKQTKTVITGLGTGSHLEYWGLNPEKLIELDWFESHVLQPGYRVFAEPTRHFSGRGLKRNQTLWSSFVLEFPTQKIYIGGDSGYGTHFKAIGKRHGQFDLAILENGQYNEDWRYIHFLPGENLKAMEDLNAKTLVPVHFGKFALSLHAWNEPIKKIIQLNNGRQDVRIPIIGGKLNWTNQVPQTNAWWEKLQ